MSDDPSTAIFADEEPRRSRPGLVASLLAAAAIVIALYSLSRGNSLENRLVELTSQTGRLATAHSMLAAELEALASREAEASGETRKQIESLLSLSRDIAALENTTAELQDRMALPQRSWARAEALALLELAQRQLNADRNIDAALEAMVTADRRLAQLREPALSTVRKQLTADLQALRSFQRPDVASITRQLRQAELDAAVLATAGIAVDAAADAKPDSAAAPGGLERAWTLVTQALANLVTIRSTASGADAVLTRSEQSLKRQRLQLLLLEARLAVIRADQQAFATAVAEAQGWLQANFAEDDERVARLAADLDGLARQDVAPALPDVSGSLRLLEQMVPLTRAGA
jgi:uroporphyrin-III C-methyltransferase